MFSRLAPAISLLFAACVTPSPAREAPDGATPRATAAATLPAPAVAATATAIGSSARADAAAPSEPRWVWTPIEGARCGNGSVAGIGVRKGPAASKRVLAYFSGGGACWDYGTCFVMKSAVHIETTYTQAHLDLEIARGSGAGLLGADPLSLTASAHVVYVPYCTGDLHAGDAVGRYDASDPTRVVHHAGARNVELIVARLAATYPNAEQILLVGSSAGGYAAQFHYERFASAFPKARVDLLADSAPLVTPATDRWTTMRKAWRLRLPETCAGCIDNLPAMADFLATRHASARFALLSFEDDSVVSAFFGIPFGELRPKLRTLLSRNYSRPNATYFVVPGDGHVLLGNLATVSSPKGGSLATWVSAWASSPTLPARVR